MSGADGAPRVEVEFQPVGRRVSVRGGSTVLAAAHEAGIALTSACGGMGSCGQCRVDVLEGVAGEPRPAESFHLSATERARGMRLACCTTLLANSRVFVPAVSVVSGPRLQVEASLPDPEPDPRITPVAVQVAPPSFGDSRGDVDRLLDAVNEARPGIERAIPAALVRAVPSLLRSAGWRGTAYVGPHGLVGFAAGSRRPLGLAVDLGTTKIAAALVDLETAAEIATAACPNPQLRFGEDVIARLGFALRRPDGAAELASTARGAINALLGEMLAATGSVPEQVVDACIVGNVAMTHLLAALPVAQLAAAPFTPAISGPLEIPATELGLGIAAGANVLVPPAIGGFVGSDHVAMILAARLDERDAAIGIDIGTNTEISLHVPGSDEIVAISCASGPAFEGAHIRHGMRAADGAIDKVAIDGEEVRITTIGDAPPRGICGSGVLDTVAALWAAGRIERNGALRPGPRVRTADHGPEFVVTATDAIDGADASEETATGDATGRTEITVTQADVRELLLAKGAIRAGIDVLLEATCTPREAIAEVVVAGAFGTFLNVESALAAGLFPPLPNATYRQVGNAAALGARWLVASHSAWERAEAIATRTRYLELTTYPRFKRTFALATLLPERGEAVTRRPG